MCEQKSTPVLRTTKEFFTFKIFLSTLVIFLHWQAPGQVQRDSYVSLHARQRASRTNPYMHNLNSFDSRYRAWAAVLTELDGTVLCSPLAFAVLFSASLLKFLNPVTLCSSELWGIQVVTLAVCRPVACASLQWSGADRLAVGVGFFSILRHFDIFSLCDRAVTAPWT